MPFTAYSLSPVNIRIWSSNNFNYVLALSFSLIYSANAFLRFAISSLREYKSSSPFLIA
jgi:hypothetical protein